MGNIDQMLGVGRPLQTITKQVLGAAYGELEDMGMEEEVIFQHFEDFKWLMWWADDWGFVRWYRPGDA